MTDHLRTELCLDALVDAVGTRGGKASGRLSEGGDVPSMYQHTGKPRGVLSQHIEPAYAWHLIDESPARIGYLLKDRVADIGVIIDALRRLQAGETVIDADIVSRLLGRHRRLDPLAPLTDREREVLALVAEGLSNRAIATRLILGERTIESHIASAFTKLGIDDSADTNRRVRVVLAWLRAQ